VVLRDAREEKPMVFRILREVLFTGGNVALDWAELGTLLET